MIKHIFVKTTLIVLLAQALCLAGDSTELIQDSTAIGRQDREDPFAKLVLPAPPVIKAAPIVQQVQQTTPAEVVPLAPARPELSVANIVVKFLDVDNLKIVLDKMLTPAGAISVDKLSNSLIICDTKETLQRIRAEVANIDKTPQLLDIEVVIVDVQLDNDTDIGVNWDMLSTQTNHLGFRQSLADRVTSTAPDDSTIGNATAFNSTGVGSDVSVVVGTVRTVVHMLQTNRKTEILASPRVLLVSGKSASIETVEEIPYQELTQTSGGGNLASTQFKNVGVKLHVTATLVDSNNILIKVEPEQNINTGTFGINNVPIIDTRRATAELMLKDSQVVIMGGLRRKEATKVRDQVPVLGSLPLIGALFGRDRNTTTNSELIVFLAPHIYKGQPISPAETKNLASVRNLPHLPIFKDDK